MLYLQKVSNWKRIPSRHWCSEVNCPPKKHKQIKINIALLSTMLGYHSKLTKVGGDFVLFWSKFWILLILLTEDHTFIARVRKTRFIFYTISKFCFTGMTRPFFLRISMTVGINFHTAFRLERIDIFPREFQNFKSSNCHLDVFILSGREIFHAL